MGQKAEEQSCGRSAQLRSAVSWAPLCSIGNKLLGAPIDWLEASEPLLVQAAQIKACQRLSLADAWIAATALQSGATLLHKDSKFQAIDALDQEWLGPLP